MKAICFICDRKYVMPTSVAIESIKYNTMENYHIHVLGIDLSVLETELLERQASDRVKVEVLECNMNDILRKLTSGNVHVSSASLMKFYIPDIITEYEKILYLDSDIIVKNDISRIWEVGTDKYALVVKDMRAIYTPSKDPNYVAYNNLNYFNSGVMLLNANAIRTDNISEKLLDARLSKERYFMDQDTFNEVFKDKVDYMPITYNGMYSTLTHFKSNDLASFYDIELPDTVEELFDKMAIVHFCSPTKPWIFYDSWCAEIWYNYYNMSPFKNVTLNRRSWKNG